ncbi:MAG TPA: hypothetical protein VFR31_10045, partial [Thermoanaerobaculia bacterium]|nr:hypothetical protein [Thermoanaerobaculia bacterium]
MKQSALLLALACALLALPSQAQVCLNFGPPPPLNTTYGLPVGQSSGDLAFSTLGIDAYVYNFALLPAGTTFYLAYHTQAPVSLPGQSLRTININMLFDLRNLAFTVKKVTLSYLDLGGYENLAVNASGIYRGQIAAAPGFPGIANVSVSSVPIPPPFSGQTGTVTITGADIESFMIGGQEFWIDNVCAHP